MFTQVTDDLFTLEQELRFSMGMTLLTRMTIVRRNKDLWVHSPLPAQETGESWYSAIKSLGEVRFLVAPSCFHYFYLEKATQQFPDAQVAAPAALAKKLPQLDIAIKLDNDAMSYPNWPSGLQPIPLGGTPKVAETLFYDSHSRSLLLTDLVFHNERGANLVTRILLRIFAPTGRPSRSLEWKFLIKDQDAFLESLQVLDSLKIDRIVGAHGRIIEDIPRTLALMRSGKLPPPLLAPEND